MRAYGDLTNQKKAAQITADDVFGGAGAMISAFIRDPEFQGQTKEKLSSGEAARLVEGAVRDHFDNWLAADPKRAGALLDFLIERAEERMKRRQEKEAARKTATKRLRLPGKLADCSEAAKDGSETLSRRGRQRGRLRQTGPQPQDPSGAAAARQDPERARRRRREAAQNQELQDLMQALGVQSGSRYNRQ